MELVLQLAAAAGISSPDDLSQLDIADASGLKLPQTSDLPAISPVLEFYKAAYNMGFAVRVALPRCCSPC